MARGHDTAGRQCRDRRLHGRLGGRGRCSRGAIKAELLAEVVQGHRGHAHVPGALDEVEDGVAAGVGMAACSSVARIAGHLRA